MYILFYWVTLIASYFLKDNIPLELKSKSVSVKGLGK